MLLVEMRTCFFFLVLLVLVGVFILIRMVCSMVPMSRGECFNVDGSLRCLVRCAATTTIGHFSV